MELLKRGHRIEQQRIIDVYYKGQRIPELIVDLIVDAQVIVDPKVVTAFNEEYLSQLMG